MVVLERWADTPFGVFGTMTMGGYSCYTLEDDWRNNERNVSAVLAGTYQLVKTLHRGTLPTYQVQGVPNRTGINIHPGVTEEHTEGCILTGADLGAINVAADEDSDRRNVLKWCVLRSREAHTQFMEAMAGTNYVPIIIRWRTW